VVADALVDNLCNGAQCGAVLFHAEITQSDVVGQIRLIAHCIEGVSILSARTFKVAFLECDGGIIYDHIRLV
jgi:hypothetical protein